MNEQATELANMSSSQNPAERTQTFPDTAPPRQDPFTRLSQIFTGRSRPSRGRHKPDQSATTHPQAPASPSGETMTYTIEEAIDAMGVGRFHMVLFAVAGLCWLADAMEMLLLSFIGEPLRCEWGLSDVEVAALTTVVFFGMMIGCVFWGRVADRYGRRVGFYGFSLTIAFFGILCAIMPSYGSLLFCRMMVGFGIGGAVIAFSLLMELIPSSLRGPYGIMFCIFWSVGAMTEAGLAWGILPTLGWRWLIGISGFPMILLIFFFPFIPESPRFYLARGRYAECVRTLEKIARMNGKNLPPGTLARPPGEMRSGGSGEGTHSLTAHVSLQHNRSDASLTRDASCGEIVGKIGHKIGLSQVMVPEVRWVTITLFVMWFIAAFSYYGIVLVSTELYAEEEAGKRCHYFDDSDIYNVEAGDCEGLTTENYRDVFVTTAGEVPGLLITMWAVQRIGRLRTIVGGSLIQAIACLLLAPCTSRGFENFLMFVLRAVSVGYFQALFVVTGEMYPASVKATVMGWCSTFARVGGILTPYAANVLSRANSSIALTLYAVAALVCTVAAYAMPYDTRGKAMPDTLSQLQEMVRSRGGKRRLRMRVGSVIDGHEMDIEDHVEEELHIVPLE